MNATQPQPITTQPAPPPELPTLPVPHDTDGELATILAFIISGRILFARKHD